MDFVSREDLSFLLHDWLNVSALVERDAFAEHSHDTFDAVLDLAADLARDTFAPHYKAADANEPRLINGKVETLPEIATALATYAEMGFFGSSFPAEVGGMQLPSVVSTAAFAHFCAANLATAAYPMLTTGNARVLVEFGNQAQIDTWAKPQAEGRYFGTMCLSEPQAGSSLADIRTKATPEGCDDFGDRYRIKGNKMWISGGDQEISENIVHLVLSKAPDENGVQQPGIKGISLFVVPKILPDGTRNDVAVAGLNHKMGYRGTVNCLLNFGEGEGAIGWRIGQPGQGLALMFQMMNEARVMVGLGAATMVYRGFTQSLDYARDRPQGRPLGQKDPNSPMTAIVEHPDVKRMILSQKAIAEGAMALVLYSARLVDEVKTGTDAAARGRADALLGLLTPITKSWPSEFGLVANDHAIQIHGGYGYTREYDVEQIYRDNRLNPIHEGTYGIQGMDFLGRKVMGDKGAALAILGEEIAKTTARAAKVPALAGFAADLTTYFNEGCTAIAEMQGRAQPARMMDNAGQALSAFGHIVTAWLWLEQALAAQGLDDSRVRLREGKPATCRFFFEVELPKVSHQLQLLRSANDAAAAVPSDLF
ncbi:acyl-CoA dehydrogenase [Phaeobacter sp. CNT1-3]|nr:acyl-CoA dehydrogenase [Phaeobacter sp. CNT1-3]